MTLGSGDLGKWRLNGSGDLGNGDSEKWWCIVTFSYTE